MKKIILVIALIAFTFNAFSQNNENKKVSKTTEVTLSAVMHCNDCSEKIRKQLAFEKGIKDVSSDHEKNIIVVKFRNDKTNVEEIIKSLDEIGYKAKVIKEVTKGKNGPTCSNKADGSKQGCCSDKAKASTSTGIAQNRSACCPTKSQTAEAKKSCCSDKAKAGEKKSCGNKAEAGNTKSCCSDKAKAGCGSKANTSENSTSTKKVSEQVKTSGCAAKSASGQGGCCKSRSKQEL